MPTGLAVGALIAMLAGIAVFGIGLFRRRVLVSLVGLALCVGALGAGIWLTDRRVSAERDILQTALAANPEAYVDGHVCPGAHRLARLFGEMDDSHADHSSPTRVMQVSLRSPKGKAQLLLYRDSARPTDWWVYADSPKEHLAGQIGGEEGIVHGDPSAACAAG